jgi:hypothetical protein
MEYIYICPRCGATYGRQEITHKDCSDCGAETVYSGFTDEQWYAKPPAERKGYIEEIKAGYVPPAPKAAPADGPTMFCQHCGEKILKDAVICPHCGCATGKTNKEDEPSIGLNLVGFLFPLVGLILYCVFLSDTPKKANAIGKWALIGFCVGLFCSGILALAV